MVLAAAPDIHYERIISGDPVELRTCGDQPVYPPIVRWLFVSTPMSNEMVGRRIASSKTSTGTFWLRMNLSVEPIPKLLAGSGPNVHQRERTITRQIAFGKLSWTFSITSSPLFC
jgi:hypothetical protein